MLERILCSITAYKLVWPALELREAATTRMATLPGGSTPSKRSFHPTFDTNLAKARLFGVLVR